MHSKRCLRYDWHQIVRPESSRCGNDRTSGTIRRTAHRIVSTHTRLKTASLGVKVIRCFFFWFVGVSSLPPQVTKQAIDEASISLIFRKIPVMVRCIITGLERGEGFAQLWNFSNFLGKTRPLCMSTRKYSCENAAARKIDFSRGRRRSWEPIASYQCCIIFCMGTYFPIQSTIVKNRPGRCAFAIITIYIIDQILVILMMRIMSLDEFVPSNLKPQTCALVGHTSRRPLEQVSKLLFCFSTPFI